MSHEGKMRRGLKNLNEKNLPPNLASDVKYYKEKSQPVEEEEKSKKKKKEE